MAATAKPEPGSRVSRLAWCQPLRSVDRKVAGRNASERMVSPDPQGSAAKSNVIEVADPISLRNSFPGIDMSAEVSCGLGFPEGAGKVDTTEANGMALRPRAVRR